MIFVYIMKYKIHKIVTSQIPIASESLSYGLLWVYFFYKINDLTFFSNNIMLLEINPSLIKNEVILVMLKNYSRFSYFV